MKNKILLVVALLFLGLFLFIKPHPMICNLVASIILTYLFCKELYKKEKKKKNGKT